MKNKKKLKIAGIIICVLLLLQTGILAYTGVFRTADDDVDISKVVVSTEIQNLIKEQEPAEYSKNLNNYKRMIVLLDVHGDFKNALEGLIKEGRNVTDIMIAYVFLNDCYGKIGQVETLVNKKESGKSWEEIFKQYYIDNPEFKPRNFDFDYLDNLMKEGGITADDVMIADRVSQIAKVPFEDVIAEKTPEKSWKDINAGFGIINGQDAMPRVPVTREQLEKYTSDGALTEDQVTRTLVTAYKLGLDEDAAISKAKSGYTTAKFFAEVLEQKYY